MRTVLVTGGAGFIGSHLVTALLRRGDTVRVFDNLAAGTLTNLAEAISEGGDRIQARVRLGGSAMIADRCEFVMGDVRDPAALDVTEA